MSISSIKIENLLSFHSIEIKELKDINCVVGKNNVGKSNLLKTIQYFYDKLDNKRRLALALHSNYSHYGKISITYDMRRIKSIVKSRTNFDKSPLFRPIYKKFFKNIAFLDSDVEPFFVNDREFYTLSLKVYSDESTEWSTKDKEILKFIRYLYPFFFIDTRHIDLYDWSYLWNMVGSIKSVKASSVKEKNIIDFFDNEISETYASSKSNFFSDNIEKINDVTSHYNLGLSKYSYKQKVLNYLKSGLAGDIFLIDGNELGLQSDGTNSSGFIQIFLALLIVLSRREYITPSVYIDEPEIGLHPKKAEEIISRLYKIYETENKKYKTPSPKIFFSTHSSNVLKMIIKLFGKEQQILHLSKDKNTKISKLKSTYKDPSFLHRFTDNEARLFFSESILFVEGETELELFGNRALAHIFPHIDNIDVYQTADLKKIKHINPSYSKADIPYYILYDIDKIFKNIDISKKHITLDKTYFDFPFYSTKYKKRFPEKTNLSTNKIPIHKELITLLTNRNTLKFKFTTPNQVIINSIGLDTNFNIANLRFKKYIPYEYFFVFLSDILKEENILITTTTIENSLINEQSINTFISWLFYELEKNTHVYFKNISDLQQFQENWNIHKTVFKNSIGLKYKLAKKRKTKETYQRIKHYKTRPVNYNRIQKEIHFKNFYQYLPENIEHNFSTQQQNYLNEIKEYKLKMFNLLVKDLQDNIDDETLPYIFVLLFNGKTPTFLKKSKINTISDNIIVSKYHKTDQFLSILKPLFAGKTSNWVSLFLNYSVHMIINECENEHIAMKDKLERIKKSQQCMRKKFGLIFQELYNIIEAVKT
ncbi:retron Eco8 family effector endonuclease [Sulfurimonas sp. ST-25]|uniref:retron Eco8 family effector endonuclease n=1 Tax=Sulfurimonas sp. ST-25 TaxID=3400151 RepID=UPI003A879FB4